MQYSVIVPAYNEEGNIELLVEKIKEVMNSMSPDWELIFINDGSRDKTYEKMLAARQSDSRIKIICFRGRFGQSAGWQAGFDFASGEIVITMDADMQNDPADIPAMVKMVKEEGFDAVSGWRASRQDSLYLKVLSKIGNWLRRIMTGDKIHDHGCSLKVYKKECLESIDFYSDLHRRYITALLTWKGFNVGEMKTRHHARRYGVSKYSIRKKWKGLLDLLVVKFWMQYSTRPIHLFGSIGILISGAGFLLGGTLGVLWLLRMISLQNRTSPLLAVLLVVIGLQLVMTGFIADTVAMTYYSTKRAYTIENLAGLTEKK
jgi:glycosyltransferase involved in cell wall biosynthesis